MSTWLITGCSSGLGRSLANAVLQHGDNVIITARDTFSVQEFMTTYPNTALVIPLDVTKHDQIIQAIKQGEERFGGIDILVNNAGYGYRAAVEEGHEAEVDTLFATNFFGPIALIKAVLPGMRMRHRGTIVNISSIAARTTEPGSGYYAATKCALEGLSRGLQKEGAPLGISVIIVEPGAFRTDFAGRSLQQSRRAMNDYAATAGLRRIGNDETSGHQPGDPEKGAQLIIKAVESIEKPKLLVLGSDAVKVVSDALHSDLLQVEAWKKESVTTDYSSTLKAEEC